MSMSISRNLRVTEPIAGDMNAPATSRPVGESPFADVEQLLAGKNYQLVERLGRGGMGEVYVVQHTQLRRRFALKVLHRRLAAGAHFADRMRIEAQAAARLEHPNIVEVIDFWVASNGCPCMIMELLFGNTVAQEVKQRGALTTRESIDFTLELLSALKAVHALGLVHRDIKPENLFLHRVGNRTRTLRLLDFGVARVMPDASTRAPLPPECATACGAIVGTPRFASPEALEGEPVDGRADLYSAGLVLHFMMTGQSRRAQTASRESSAMHLYCPREPVSGLPLSRTLEMIISKSLAHHVEQRYQNATQFYRALKSCRERLVEFNLI
jgi:serine/threonine protein kinase